jgi:WD40 repeat protein
VGQIFSISAAETEPLILVLGKDGNPSIWNLDNDDRVATLPDHPTEITAGVISPDGAFCITGSGDAICRFFDSRTGDQLRKFKAADAITSLAICGHSPYVAAGCADGCITLFNFKQNEVLNENQIHDAEVTSVAFHPDQNCILSGSNDMKIIISTIPKLTVSYTLGAHKAGVRSVAWSLNGDQFVSCGDDRGVFIWSSPGDDFGSDYEEEEEVRNEEEELGGELQVEGGSQSQSAALSPKGVSKLQMMRSILDKVQDLAAVVQTLEQRMKLIDDMIDQIEKANAEEGQVVNRAYRPK